MKRLAVLLMGTFALGFAGCSTMEVDTHKDSRANLARYTTYQWVTQEQAEKMGGFKEKQVTEVTSEDPIAKYSARDVVDAELRRSGFEPAVIGTPDFYVTFYAVKAEKESLTNWGGAGHGIDYGLVGISGIPYGGPTIIKYTEGTLALLFLDGRTKQPAWRGIAKDVVDVGDQERYRAKVADATQEMLADFRAGSQ